MELNAFSIRERARVGKEAYKLKDLKKVEALIEEAADKGLNGVEITYSHLENFQEHYKFILADLAGRDFNVSEGFWGAGQIDNLWISWA